MVGGPRSKLATINLQPCPTILVGQSENFGNPINFDRALELAVQYKTHVDTVLWYRQRFLSNFRRKETNEAFLSYASQVELNEDAIKAKIKSEKEKEASRPGAKRYVGL